VSDAGADGADNVGVAETCEERELSPFALTAVTS